MSDDARKERMEAAGDTLRQAGLTAYRASVLAVATLLVLVMFVGMAILVYQGNMQDGPLILFAGVILGYLLKSVQNMV